MTKSLFNAIVILDAVPEDEINPAQLLRWTLKSTNELTVQYLRLNTMNDLQAGMRTTLNEIQNNDLKPWLHLNGHGLEDQSGFVFANGSPCRWDELRQLITPLNEELRLNLYLILATCFGGSFARAIDTTDRAPVLGLIGPINDVDGAELVDVFSDFYRTLYRTQSFSKALNKLDTKTQSSYYRTTAEDFFCDVWNFYMRNLCNEEEIENRVRVIRKQYKKQNTHSSPCSVGQLKRTFRRENPVLFEKFRNHYFMYDLYEGNKERFSLTLPSS
ncbi:hypothetical protein H206_00271 [Candidatus Electrothrix aarhusensis]|uniref:CHAT domain-containing protein n=1 Tax=Candidatus Electrothrix aarhusensis TaxID=1859131 RepID=A0A3S3RS57_9BACT|nr:hypothetical protein H206_00271 [Candidatus Electrothrix aarhusensis]